jgi:hypothetical protein
MVEDEIMLLTAILESKIKLPKPYINTEGQERVAIIDISIAAALFSENYKLHWDAWRNDIESHEIKRTYDEFTRELTGAQVTALEACVRRRFGILSGPMRSGKRRTALAWICERRTPTLVIVKTKLQLHHWQEDALALTNAGPDAVGGVVDRAYATNLKVYHELVAGSRPGSCWGSPTPRAVPA